MALKPMTIALVLVSLFTLVIVMRLTLRASAEWKVLKKNWTWKDELLDTLFYFVILAVAVFGLFILIQLFPFEELF